MDLLHWSDRFVTDVNDSDNGSNISSKPYGLWVSPDTDDGWRQWCESEGFRTDRFTHATRVEIKRDAKVIRIDNAGALAAFGSKYGSDYPFADRLPPSAWRDRHNCIDWRRMSQDFDGILIVPYIGSMRMDSTHFWYYPWDCASGCIWRARAIRGLHPVEKTNVS